MNTIKEHLKLQSFKPVYLLYGSEDYLKHLYRDKLKDGILNGGSDMNYSYFEGKSIDTTKVMDIADTLPFLSQRRLIILENSGFFKNQSTLADDIETLPNTTHIVFVEQDVDKRNRLFKAVKKLGYTAELNGMDEKNLKLWIATVLKQNNKKMTEQDIMYLINKSGTDMNMLSKELEKLICYGIDRNIITASDIDAVCITQVSNKIFQMMDYIAQKQAVQALNLYKDLLSLQERPLSILFLLTRHFNILLQTKDLQRLGHDNRAIASKAGIPPFTVGKYLSQGKNFSSKQLKNAITECVDLEERVKTGRITDQMALELLLVKFSS